MTFEKSYLSCLVFKRSKKTSHSIVEKTNLDLSSSLLAATDYIMLELSTRFSVVPSA